jgi:hypothetical protein
MSVVAVIETCPECGERRSGHAADCLNPAGILDDAERFIRRFVSFQSRHQSAAFVLFVAHVYAIDAAPSAAYLRITSAVEESGKTPSLEVLEQLLGDRCLNMLGVTPSFVFRIRDKVGPVALLLDEIDNTLKDRKDDGARDLLALVNGGYRRSAKVGRSVGRDHEGRVFRAFGPCAIAGLGSLHPTTESRCIPIVLERKERGAGERWLPHLVEDEASALSGRLAAWATPERIAELKAAQPSIPPELRDRHAEAWWGLFAIADAAGEDWPMRAREAAVALHAHRDAATTWSVKVLLLAHVREAFAESGRDRLSTAELLRRLVENEEGPWGRFWGVELGREGPPRAAATELAAKLRDFRTPAGGPIKPHGVRLPDGTTPRGYYLADFADAFERYLPATAATPATRLASPVAPVAGAAGGMGQGVLDG